MRHFPQKELCRFWKDDRFHRRDEALTMVQGFPGGASGREPACQCGRHKRCRFDPWVGKIPWRRAWQPTPVFCLKNPMGRGVWWLQSMGSQSQTRLRQLSTARHMGNYIQYLVITYNGIKSKKKKIPESLCYIPETNSIVN